MGKHYVPQKHLRRFAIADRPGSIWMYDKTTQQFRDAAISKVAQNADFYSDSVEIALANEVERPGNIAIDKLLNRESLSDQDKVDIAKYVMCMSTRGPRQRRKSVGHLPEALETVIEKWLVAIDKFTEAHPEECDLAEERRKEVLEIQERFSLNTPSEIEELVRTPFLSEQAVSLILRMTWHLVPSDPRARFVTCDTPAHLDEGRGIGSPDSEFTFSISPEWALICENRSQIEGSLFIEKPDVNISKEINRRILSHTERFVFSPRREDWIATVAQKEHPRLNNIRWR